MFFGGINVFLQQKLPIFRHLPDWFHKLLNHSGLLSSAAKRSHMTSAREHGEMAARLAWNDEERIIAEEQLVRPDESALELREIDIFIGRKDETIAWAGNIRASEGRNA